MYLSLLKLISVEGSEVLLHHWILVCFCLCHMSGIINVEGPYSLLSYQEDHVISIEDRAKREKLPYITTQPRTKNREIYPSSKLREIRIISR